MCKSIAFLLGAGFSAPAGLPTANTLNNIIQSKIYARIRNSFRNGYQITLNDFVLEKVLIESDECGAFNYEQYFDLLVNEENQIPSTDRLLSFIERGMYGYLWKCSVKNDSNYIKHRSHIDSIYRKIDISNYAQSVKKEEQWYQKIIAENVKGNNTKRGKIKSPNPLYNDFVNIISTFVSQGYNIDIYTLNHDLFLESLLSFTELKDKVCNGFGGEIDEIEKQKYCSFDRKYFNNQIRIYKLHGSIDFYKLSIKTNPPKYIQMVDGYDYENGGLMDSHEITSILPLFLTGKSGKNSQYAKEPYNSMLNEFENNVGKAEKLIVIGYSGYDEHINEKLFNQQINWSNTYVVDPNANKHPFVEDKQAIAVSKSVELLSDKDICQQTQPKKQKQHNR